MSHLHWPAALAGDRVFITDGGLETTLIFEHGLELPDFASFAVLGSDEGEERLRGYYEGYVSVAREHGVGAVLGAPTWRAHADWGDRLGYSPEELAAANRRAVDLVALVRDDAWVHGVPVVVSGDIGPRGDGYEVGDTMTAEEAEAYHRTQIATLAEAGADLISAYTMTYADEATGLARAAAKIGIPVLVSFTTETDGHLPSGQSLRDAVEQVDADTGGAPVCFMVNCSHPTHFSDAFTDEGPWLERIGGLRANPSPLSHAELDASETLQPGDPEELAAHYTRLRATLPELKIIGGCCGTNEVHAGALCAAWRA